MTAQAKWLSLVDDSQRETLLGLLDSSPRFRRENAEHMLLAPGGWPSIDEASVRVAEVIAYLNGGAASVARK